MHTLHKLDAQLDFVNEDVENVALSSDNHA